MDSHNSRWQEAEGQIHQFAQKRKKAKSKQNLETEFRSEIHKTCYHILHNQLFELVFGAVIVFNLVLVMIETDAVAKDQDVPPWADASSWIVLTLFVAELILRLFVLKADFWYDECCVFDFVLVLTDVVLNLIGLFAGRLFPVSFLRIIRLFKLARVGKVFAVFPELRLMMAGLLGSLQAIFWGTVLLAFVLLVFAILAVQFVQPYNLEVAAKGGYAGCERCSRAYASVFDATVTLTQQVVAGDSWGEVTIPVMEHAPSTSLFFASVFLIIGMAVLNLILGVVVDIASQARDKMATELEDEKTMERLEVHCHLLEICKALDKNDNGEISKEELNEGWLENEHFRNALEFMDVSHDDLEVLWTILDADKSGAISYAEFVTSCYKLKSSNTHFILAHVKYYITVIKNKLCDQLEQVKDEMLQAEQKMEAEILKEEHAIMKGMEQLEEEEKLAAEEIHENHQMLEVGALPLAAEAVSDSGAGLEVSLRRAACEQSAATAATDAGTRQLLELVTCLTGELKTLMDGIKKPSLLAIDEKVDKFVQNKDAASADPQQLGDAPMVPLLQCTADEWQTYFDVLQKSNQQQAHLVQLMEGMKDKLDLDMFTLPTPPGRAISAPQALEPAAPVAERQGVPYLNCCQRGVPANVRVV